MSGELGDQVVIAVYNFDTRRLIHKYVYNKLQILLVLLSSFVFDSELCVEFLGLLFGEVWVLLFPPKSVLCFET